MEEVERGRVVRVEMEDVASGLEWTQIGVYMPVRGQAKVTIAASGGTQDAETKDPAQGAWESLSDELDKIHGEYMIGGDFNAETEAFLRGRGKMERTLSDRMFNSMLTEAGRDLRAMANEQRRNVPGGHTNRQLDSHPGASERHGTRTHHARRMRERP